MGMLNNNLIHAMELSVILGLSTSAFAYDPPVAAEDLPQIKHTPSWTFEADSNPQYNALSQHQSSTRQGFSLPSTMGRSSAATQEYFDSHATYAQAAYNRFSITTNLIPESSRWFMQAKASTRTRSYDTNTPDSTKKVTLNTMPYQNEDYVVFPDIVKTGIPILAPALEDGLNRMVRRRLRKTAKRYGPYLAERQLKALLELNGPSQTGQANTQEMRPDHINELYYEGRHFVQTSPTKNIVNRNTASTHFDFNQSDDMNSVLDYYNEARKNPSVRVSGEMGYESERLNWRLGGQKQKIRNTASNLADQKNINIYSVLNLKLTDRITYFNVMAHQTSKNSFGVHDFSTKKSTDYHRLNYNLSDDLSVFAAQGKIDHDVFGTTQSTQIGLKNCWALQNQFSFCSSLGHHKTKYSESSSQVIAQDNSGYMALMTFKMTL
jgi:hypothetical protein